MTGAVRFLAALALATAVGAACSNDETNGGATGSSSTTSTSSSTGGGSQPMPPDASCARPGDLGNDVGVGHFCTPGGGECKPFALAPLCLADVAQDQWMCTRIGCDEKTSCGKDAGCLITDGGSACVPCDCDATTSGCKGGSGGAGGTGGAAGQGGAGGGG
jgi:hypothetical protein